MPHFRVDDGLDSHPKVERAGDDAIGMWTRAGAWCMRYLTDGFVPDWWVKKQPKGIAKAKKLVAVGLWEGNAERDGEKGYLFHEFVGPGRQDSREKVEADRELARRRKQKSRGESQRDVQRDTPRDGQRPSHQESRRSPGYTQPNPTQPMGNPVVNSGGDLAKRTARDSETPHPPRCLKHINDPTPPACGDCAEARRAAEAATVQAAEAATQRARARRAEIDDCDECDPNGWLLDDEGVPVVPARRCANHDWEMTNGRR